MRTDAAFSAALATVALVLAVSPWQSEAAGSGTVAAYTAANAKVGQRIVGCPLADSVASSAPGLAIVAATKSMQGCAALCRTRSPDCAAFAFSAAQAKCELSTGAPGSGACALNPADGWVAFNLNDFKEPSSPVGVCDGPTKICLNDGICLSRTEQTGGSYVCACQAGYTGDKCQNTVAQPKWSSWSDYSACSSTCGQGVRKRSRQCLDSSNNPVAAVAACGSDSPDVFEACSSSVCPSWSDWSAWSVCNTTTTCGPGVRQRTRTCANGGAIGTDCRGNAVESTPCNSVSCSLQGAPVSLNPVIKEAMTLGKGYVQIYSDTQDKTGYVCSDGFDNDKEGVVVCRSLGFDGVQDLPATSSLPAMPDAPLYLLSKLECSGTEDTLQSCPHSAWSNSTECATGRVAYVLCKVSGRWSAWEGWESCEGKCGSATRNRNRTCTNPRPLGGLSCDGDGFQEAGCPGLSPCPVDGSWTQWSTWQTCSVLCGGGTKTRQRSCTPPQFGGADCVGSKSETATCNTNPCPIDGVLTNWTKFSNCSQTCGGGIKTRERSCIGPFYGGAACDGPLQEKLDCNTQPCPVDGQWSGWTNWTSCSVSCGGGTRQRSRQCNNPSPADGGSDCVGSAVATEACATANCPVNGYFKDWSAWSACTRTCGGGSHTRTRDCVQPMYGGLNCSGEAAQSEACMTQACPIPGEWLAWQSWGYCSQTCAGGVRVRTRQCNMTAYGNLTIDCVGNNTQSGECNTGVECIAVRSCQDLKNTGFDYDMTTIIDPDGPSGPIEPFNVFCRLSGSDSFGYSVVNTTNMSLPGIYAHGSEPGGSIHIHIGYKGGATAEQLNSLAKLSLNCSQFVRYTCRDAGIHYQNNVYLQATWWVNYRWQQMLGWAQPYNLRYQSVCACHATGSCGTLTTNVDGVDTVVQATCNCDRNERVDGVFDEGTIYDKDNLPVNEVWVGDTGDDTEWSFTYVGPLVCWGVDPSAGRK